MNELEIILIKDLNEAVHYHSEIELFFVVAGSAQITIKNKLYELEQEDIIVINSGEIHSVDSSLNSVLCVVQFSCRKVLELINKNTCIFECNSKTDKSRPYSTIRTVMREVIYQYVKQKPEKTKCLTIGVLYKLLDCLIENYMEKSLEQQIVDDDARVRQICQYVNSNFQYGINMSELADILFISTSTLSRVFKKQTGLYFADYVANVRMSHAVDALLRTEDSITKIAMDCGFSNPSVFNRNFKEVYGMPPSDYRTQKKEQRLKQEKKRILEQEQLRKELSEQFENQSINIMGQVNVSVNVKRDRAFENRWNDMINIGSVDMLCNALTQKQVLFLKRELGFTYARIWSIFSQNNKICTGKLGSGYNFSRLDHVFDFLIENDMIPFLDFGNRPDVAVGELGIYVFESHDYILFESRAAWEECLSNLMEHLVERYGKDKISNWRFEFSSDQSNVPVSNYYADNDYSYNDAFQYALKLIKSLVPDAMVGGPMAMMNYDEQFAIDFLSACKKRSCVPDFVSFALFPYRTQKVDGRVVSEPAMTDNIEMEYIDKMQKILLVTGCTDCKLFITEWNNSVSNRNYLNDSNFRGAYIICRLPDISESVDMISIWMASDIISSYVDSSRIANGGGGLLTQDGIPKPAFFALRFMNQLGDRLISKGENYIITKGHKTSYYIICHNFKWYNCNYFKKRELLDNPRDIEELFENTEPVEIHIQLDGLIDKKQYIITMRHVAASYGNLLGEWKKFQYDEHLSADNIKYIKDASFPRMSMERKKTEQNSLTLSVNLKAHEFALLHIYEDKLKSSTVW